MKTTRPINAALIAVCLSIVPLALVQGGDPPASTEESKATSGHGMTAVEQTAKSRETANNKSQHYPSRSDRRT